MEVELAAGCTVRCRISLTTGVGVGSRAAAGAATAVGVGSLSGDAHPARTATAARATTAAFRRPDADALLDGRGRHNAQPNT